MNIQIQPETPQHYHAVNEILLACFKQEAESKLVATLRENGKVILSLVAVHEGKVVGHALFSPVTTSPPCEIKGLGLAPLAVKPEYQKQGIGSKLIYEGLRQCTEMGYDFVVLLGSPEYYQRFGFQRASSFGLQNEYGVDDEFMALELREACLRGVNALVKYVSEFLDLNV